MDPAQSIEKPLEVLKNTSKGQKSEELVCQHLQRQGWKIIHRNHRYFGVEIDLLAEKNQSFILVEVKTLSSEYHTGKIIKHSQKQRLKRVAQMLSEEKPNGLQLLIALVNKRKDICFFEIF